jgi:superfamily I DNA/RNA helicase
MYFQKLPEGGKVDVLASAGSVVSLIGDVHQSIFGFNFATGSYPRDFGKRQGVLSLPLSQNRRSLSPIVNFANALAGTHSKPHREACDRLSGTFYWRYDGKLLSQFMSAWATALKAKRYELSDGAVLCRGNSLLAQLSTGVNELGQSATKNFAAAAVVREQRGDIALALDHCAKGVGLLILGLPHTFARDMKTLDRDGKMTALRRLVWRLIRDQSTGIPLSGLAAKSMRLPALKENTAAWLDAVEAQTDYRRVESWRHRVKSNKLPDGPLVATDCVQKEWGGLRFGTVHSVKGEGIPAVMYLTQTANLDALVIGAADENGRIGFVAATRARDLLVVGIPEATGDDVIKALQDLGLTEWVQA